MRGMGKELRGQLTVEFLLMLAILLVIIVAFFYISQGSEAGVRQAKIKGESLSTLKDLSAAAKEVYAQGTGAKKQVYITIPEGYEPEKSFIGNSTIKMRVSGNDYIENEQFDLHGTLPASPGGHWVWVLSEGSGVRIGYALIEVSLPALVVNMEPNSSREAGFSIRNIWYSDVNITEALELSGIDGALAPGFAGITPGQEDDFSVYITADDKTVGLFVGEIHLSATDGEVVEYVNIPITIVVHGREYQIEEGSLAVFPSALNDTFYRNTTTTRSFQVCTDESTSLDSVAISTSPGAPGHWTKGTEPLGPIAPDTCLEKLLNFTVPLEADLGLHEGQINFSADDASAVVDLQITIGGDPYDTEGPDVRQISVAGRAFANQPVEFVANAADKKSRIKKCELAADGAAWEIMQPVDGTYDELDEHVSYTHLEGFDAGGHTARVRCTDSNGNVGTVKEIRFKVLKELLFVRLGSSMSQSEKEWSDWIGLHSSGAGYSWEYDVGSAQGLVEGNVNLSNYAVIVMAEYDLSAGLAEVLNEHRDSGGYVVLLGAANKEGLFALCQSNERGGPRPEKDVRLYITDHYITSPYASSSQQVFTIDSKIYYIGDDYIGLPLVVSSSDHTIAILGVNDKIVSWGPERPFRFNENGIELTIRAIDFAIMDSTKK